MSSNTVLDEEVRGYTAAETVMSTLSPENQPATAKALLARFEATDSFSTGFRLRLLDIAANTRA